jgi:hypothetical protein
MYADSVPGVAIDERDFHLIARDSKLRERAGSADCAPQTGESANENDDDAIHRPEIFLRLPAANQRHLGRHHGHEQDIGGKWQICHVAHSLGHVA